MKVFFRVLRITVNLGIITGLVFSTHLFLKNKDNLTSFTNYINSDIEVFESLMDNKNLYRRPYDTVILDKNFNKHFEINNNNYYYNEIKEINPLISKFYTVIEDEDFYNHSGIDIQAIARSFLSLVQNDGEIVQGGSTITQQVIKNNIIPKGYNIYKRKIVEILIAGKFEELYTKDEIMEFYLNSTYYGNNIYGINNASLYYFGKYTSQLNISEIAMLVGMSNAPSKYNPKASEELAIQKRNIVLNKLLSTGTITQQEYDDAVNYKPTYVFKKDSKVNETYPTSYAIHSATELLIEQQGFKFQYIFKTKQEEEEYRSRYKELYSEISDEIRGGGYVIYTTLDPTLQNILQEEFNKQITKTKDLNGSATLIDNTTNTICAIVGGLGDTEFNRAYQSFRQPGSAIKPIVAYAPAFSSRKYTPDSTYIDKPPTKKWQPKNWDNKYIGRTTFRNALAKSINSIPYNLVLELGIDKSLAIMEKLQFSNISYLDLNNPSISIGGFTYGVSSEELTRAYNMIVNNCKYKPNQFIFKITDDKGNIIYKSPSTEYQVLEDDIAYLLLDLLKEPLYASNGTGRGFKIPNHKQIGKTGTTNDDKDEWFIGATAYYTLGVYSGYDMPKTIRRTINSGTIYKNVMTRIHKDLESKDFKVPDTIEFRNGKPISVPNITYKKVEEYRKSVQKFLDMKLSASNIDNYIYSYNKTLELYSNIPEKSLTEEVKKLNEQVIEKYNQSDIEEIQEEIRIIELNKDYEELKGILEENYYIYINSSLDIKCKNLLSELKEHSEYSYLYDLYISLLTEEPTTETTTEEMSTQEVFDEFSTETTTIEEYIGDYIEEITEPISEEVTESDTVTDTMQETTTETYYEN